MVELGWSLVIPSYKTLAEYILQEETRVKRECIGARRSHDYDLTRALEIIAEDFRETAFGKVVQAEELSVEALCIPTGREREAGVD